ncbi:MAG: hypothetical protein CM15mP120_12740 [Pseudomonadota bacterium]|nr:MAG: hypothetical protein CM15mP120_12740 [Pseudomonadota bacterium]
MHAGLGINAGHDLDQQNLPLFANLPGLAEVSIGHAIICEALIDGFGDTVAAYAKNSAIHKRIVSCNQHRF